MSHILIVGNGFDIAQELPTRYTDFMDFLRIEDPVLLIERIKNGDKPDEKVKRFFGKVENIDLKEIQRMKDIQKNNSWARYYLSCHAEIKGWIDFEKEMHPVFDFFNWLLSEKPTMVSDGESTRAMFEHFPQERYRMAILWPRYVEALYKKRINVKPEFCDISYGIFHEKILEALKQELDNFTEMLQIYLWEIPDQVERKKIPRIDDIKADTIVSFNYTESETAIPELVNTKTYHVHGALSDPHGIVLGVNRVPDDPDNEFVFFTKSFQRIRKFCDPGYKKLLMGAPTVSFFGHSLDKTDEDIIKPFFESAGHVNVYYYSPRDYEEKIANLIRLIGIDELEDWVFHRKLEFKPSG